MPLCLVFQSESKCETILMKMSLICMKMKLHVELIFIRMVSHLDSFWNRGTRELGNGLFTSYTITSLKTKAKIWKLTQLWNILLKNRYRFRKLKTLLQSICIKCFDAWSAQSSQWYSKQVENHRVLSIICHPLYY